jgi:hypothetical protein
LALPFFNAPKESPAGFGVNQASPVEQSPTGTTGCEFVKERGCVEDQPQQRGSQAAAWNRHGVGDMQQTAAADPTDGTQPRSSCPFPNDSGLAADARFPDLGRRVETG